MPERTHYDPGTPSWVDLATPDPEAAKRFYGELFGWEAAEAGPVEETGGYAFFTLNGRNVAGVGALQDPSQPPAWSTYVSTDDADALVERARVAGTVAMPPGVPDEVPAYWLTWFAVEDADAAVDRVQQHGGSVTAPPMDMPSGRFAVVADPHGVQFGIVASAPGAGV
jgi:predicted enzyme related to lactoylglutathione lyase